MGKDMPTTIASDRPVAVNFQVLSSPGTCTSLELCFEKQRSEEHPLWLDGRINPDPVVSHASLDRLTMHGCDDEVRFLHWHMAINAVVANFCARRPKFTAIGFFVTLQTLFRIGRGRSLRCVDFVAGRTGHLGVLIAATSLR